MRGLVVSAEGLGCIGLTQAGISVDEASSSATINHALDVGITLLDTADAYGPLLNEQLIGRVIASRRDEVVVATKFGLELDADGRRTGKLNGRPEYVRRAVDGSLQRLGIEVIDVYYQHRVDSETPIEETFGALAELVECGKVRHLGLSEAAPDTIRRAHAVHPVTVLQTEYSLFTRDVEIDGVLSTIRELGIGLVPYAPLGRGLLSGRFRSAADLACDDRRRQLPRFRGDNLAQNLITVDQVRAIAEAKDITPSQLALAWLIAQGEDVVPIPGTRRISTLDENVAAVGITLTPDELAALDMAAPRGVAVGERYPPALMRDVYR